MKRFKISLLLIFTFFISLSCNNEENQKHELYIDYLKQVNNKIENGNYLIISNSSCKSCVKKAYEILKKEKTQIILTESLKIDSIEITKKYNNFTVNFDRKDAFLNKKYNKIFSFEPIYIKIEDKKIKHLLSFDILQRDRSFVKLMDIVSGYY